ncbi:flagellar basal body L-ring protein [Halioglobus japonicus]|uniref:Flagellar L-ring protein n=2 Tax=Halieaceae TaxID=1706372 RepID=A0AAP8SNS3_9GAMM|nr:flagellar basal body L-ring protein [Halioglobus japonicus]KZX55167.1 flagellar basal body L-ring protein [Halioglobus sp. HI00S01]PLW86942.1 flagellar basal body L-ring protein [Halioglobus japonicus]
MNRHSNTLLIVSLLVSSCAQVPGSPQPDNFPKAEIQQPEAPVADGSIYHDRGVYMPLFEDRRPRRPGDIITIVLNERVSASKNSSAQASREGTGALVTTATPEGLEELNRWGFDISGSSEFAGSGGAQASNRLTGTITVTVADVLINGNLHVVGEKRILINQGAEFLRFSGVVNPLSVDEDNSVRSSEVADAQIEYTGKGYISEAQRMGWLQRLFNSVSPY